MRTEFAQAMVRLFGTRSDLVFVTADLGYMALERVAETYGARFINAGVAEQNAVSLTAGMAREGLLPWVYSTAAFTVLRPYEQIRNDVCLHELPVKLVGNGGGFGFGIMGATHHCLEDLAAMRVLPHLRVYVPLVADDVEAVVQTMTADPGPGYLRLNLPAQLPGPVPPFATWRRLKEGKRGVVISTGPVVQRLYELAGEALFDELELWSVGVFPFGDLPAELLAGVRRTGRVVTLEEHYQPGGLGEAVAHALLVRGAAPAVFQSLHAIGYPSGRYGSQRWHQEENGLGGPLLRARLEDFLRG